MDFLHGNEDFFGSVGMKVGEICDKRLSRCARAILFDDGASKNLIELLTPNRCGHLEPTRDTSRLALPIPGLIQQRGNSHAVAGLPHTALEDRPHAERNRDLGYVRVLSLECECRCPHRDLEAVDLSKRIQQLFRKPIAEVFVFGVRTHVCKRKYGDRGGLGGLRFEGAKNGGLGFVTTNESAR